MREVCCMPTSGSWACSRGQVPVVGHLTAPASAALGVRFALPWDALGRQPRPEQQTSQVPLPGLGTPRGSLGTSYSSSLQQQAEPCRGD